MSRKNPKAGDLIHTLGQKKERRRRRTGDEPRPDPLKGQFSLGALMLLMTVASLGLTYFYYLGTTTIEEVGKVRERAMHDVEDFPNSSAAEFVPLAAGIVSVSVACLLGSAVFYQPTKRGLAVVWMVTCISVLGLVLFLSLSGRPLANTPLKELKWKQVLPIAGLTLSCTLPLGAIGGWCARVVSRS
jgi:hypothetical protein